ncbi:MAG: HAMP domain-containing histidine kinase [Bacteroidetes bacterium]|nr:HAMP domain-containing histidine kinase [Bacteroidota bacterium]
MTIIPSQISEYIDFNKVENKLDFYFLLSEESRILEAGSFKNSIDLKSSIGEQILNIAPYLVGYFPLQSLKLILPKIEISASQVYDIHLVKDGQNVFVLYFNSLAESLDLKHKVQPINEKILREKMNSEENCIFDQHLLSMILASINIVSFERIEKGKFKLIGHKPFWFSDIFSEEEVEKAFIAIQEKFIFIETFLEEARELWKKKENNLISSELWTEVNNQGKEYYLQAYALSIEERDILFIKMIDYSKDSEVNILQKARRKNLDYEYLLKAERELERVLKFKEQFISIISHDLRSPVTAISGFSDLLMRDEEFQKKLNIEQKEIISFINLSVKRLLDYTKKIYHWSNLELGKFKLTKQKINLYYVCREVENTFIMDLKSKHISLELSVPSTLIIEADETLLNQAINNLVGNAIKFTPENGSIKITASNNESGSTSLSIKDSGVGMKPDALKKLFKDHFEGHTVGTAGEIGSGLGLSIVKRILDAHNFKIDVKSQINEGTDFTILFP